MKMSGLNDSYETFGKEYFNGDRRESEAYKSYKFEDWYPWFKIWAITIKELYNPSRVLDIGCAKGYLVKALKDLGIEAYGVDISEYALTKAPKDVNLSFKNEYFDFVCSFVTLEYLKNHKHALSEMRRVLKKGRGILLTTVYKKDKRDKLRINVHDMRFWVKEFEFHGFKFDKQKTDELIKIRLKNLFSSSYCREQDMIKLRIGKRVWKMGNIILLTYN